MDLLSLIDSWSRRCPERLAHVSHSGTLTWAELVSASDALAALLEVTLGDRGPVVVYGHKEGGMPIAFLGCVKAGHAYVPVDTSLPPERVRRIVEDSGTRLVLSPTEVPPEVHATGVRVLDAASSPTFAHVLAAHAGRRPAPDARITGDGDFYVIYTSGSTGDPKGVRIPLAALSNFIEWMVAEQRPREAAEVYLNQAPFSFDLSVIDLYMSLATGGTLFSVDREMIARPAELFHALRRSGITTWVSTPSFAEMCLAEPSFAAESLPEMRRFLFDGEVLTSELAAELCRRFPRARVWNLYGPTEATVAVTSIEVTSGVLATYHTLPVGRVAPGSDVRVLDPEGAECVDAERGELVIVGPTVSTGYLGNPGLTAARFFTDERTGSRGYRTGDIGYREGELVFYSGRIDFQVKLHGYRIELGDIESNLLRLPEVRGAAVLPVVRDGRAEYLKAFVVLRDGQGGGTSLERGARLRTRLAESLPDYMVPRRIAFVDSLPMTPNGKIDRRALAEGGS